MRWFIIVWSLSLGAAQTSSPTKQPTRQPTTSVPTLSPTVVPAVSLVKVYGGFRRDLANVSISLDSFPSSLKYFPFNSVESQCVGPQIASRCYVSSPVTYQNETSMIFRLSPVQNIFVADTKNISIPQIPSVPLGSYRVLGHQIPTIPLGTSVPYSLYINLPNNFYLGRIIKVVRGGAEICAAALNASRDSQCERACTTHVLEGEMWLTLSMPADPDCGKTSSFNNTRFRTLLGLNPLDVTEGPAILPITVPRNFSLELNPIAYALMQNKSLFRATSIESGFGTTASISFDALRGPNPREQLYVWGRPSANAFNELNTNSFRILPVLGAEVLTIKLTTPYTNFECLFNITQGTNHSNFTCDIGLTFSVTVTCNATSPNFCGATAHAEGNLSRTTQELINPNDMVGEAVATSPSPTGVFDFYTLMSHPGTPLPLYIVTPSLVHRIDVTTIIITNITFYGQNNRSLPIGISGDFVSFAASTFAYTFPLATNFTIVAQCNLPPCIFSISHVDEENNPDSQTNLASGQRSQPFKVSNAAIRIWMNMSAQFVYNFAPYVRTFANVAFRVSQYNDSESFNEYPHFFDTLIPTYHKSVLQYFTFTVEIYHCTGAMPACLYHYSFLNYSGTGSSGQSSVVLKLPAPIDSMDTNFSAPLVITSGDGTGSYTFYLSLSPTCDDGYYFPSISRPVRCPVENERREACCSCPLHATCHDPLKPPRPEAGYVTGELQWDIVKCDPPQACLEGGVCATGYANAAAACSLCQSSPPHYRVNRFCEECPTYTVFVAVIGFLLFLCALALFVKISKPDHTKKFTLAIALGYAQIISIFATFPVPWPPIVIGLFDVFSFLNFNVDLFSPECAVQVGFFSKWLFKVFLPIITVGIFGIVYIMVLYVPRVRNWYVSFLLWDIEDVYDNFIRRTKLQKMLFESEEKRQAHENALALLQQNEAEWHQARIEWEETHLEDRFINALVTAATIGYTFIAKTASEPLNCVGQVGGSKRYVRADPSAYCYEGEWYSYQILSILFTIIYTAGIPVFFAFLLIRAKRGHYLHEQAFYYRYGHLVLPYRAQFWYWELVQLLRKLITIQLIEFFYSLNGRSLAQVNSVLITLIIFLALQEFLKPYEFSWCNRVAFCWNIASVLVLCSALLFDLGLDPDASTLYGIALVIVCTFTLGLSLYAFWLENKRSRARKALFNGTTMLTREKEEQDLLLSLFGTRLGSSLHRKVRDLLVDDRTLLYSKLNQWAGTAQEGATGTTTTQAVPTEMVVETEPQDTEPQPTPPLLPLPSPPGFNRGDIEMRPPPLPPVGLRPTKARPPPLPPTSKQPPPLPHLAIDDPPRRPIRLSQYARNPVEEVTTAIPPPRPPRRQFPGMRRQGSEGFTEMKQI